MKTKTIGIGMIIIGIILLLYNSFNYVTTEKVVDIGPIQINKEVNHPVEWSPVTRYSTRCRRCCFDCYKQ